jgi:hypothetical protein
MGLVVNLRGIAVSIDLNDLNDLCYAAAIMRRLAGSQWLAPESTHRAAGKIRKMPVFLLAVR